MDIHQWLEKTELPERPPSLPERLDLPPFLHPRENTKESITRNRRRKKRVLTDSSLLEARQKSDSIPPSERGADIDDAANGSTSSGAPAHSDPPSESEASSHQYARRPRHKTKLERYEPKSKDVKERGTQSYRKGKDESRKTKRRSRRKNTERPGAGLVQSFHAKNVPKDRLTLKPRDKLGIFNKGRASSPVRGRGLPDLVFSEMKFLQKNGGAVGEQNKPEAQRKRRKNDHTHAKEEEISAYFTSTRPVLAERDGNARAKPHPPGREPLLSESEHNQRISPHVDNPIPTIELPGKPYLGFGTRGPRHESTSYFSWSDSTRASSELPKSRRAVTSVGIGQLEPNRNDQERPDVDSAEALRSHIDQRSQLRDVVEQREDHFAVSSPPPASHAGSQRNSLPPGSTSIRTVQRPYRDTSRRSIGSTTSPPSSSILNRTEQQVPCQQTHIHSSNNTTSNEPHSENSQSHRDKPLQPHKSRKAGMDDLEPQTSSSLGRLLRECDSVFAPKTSTEFEHSLMENVQRRAPIIADNGTMETEKRPYEAEQRQSIHLPFTGPHRRLPVLDRPNIYEEQARRVSFVQEPEIHYENLDWVYGIEERTEEDDAWLEDYGQGMIHALDDSAAIVDCGPVEGLDFSEGEEQPRAFDKRREPDALEGFWRPHKLY